MSFPEKLAQKIRSNPSVFFQAIFYSVFLNFPVKTDELDRFAR